jgi:hypothetical protein
MEVSLGVVGLPQSQSPSGDTMGKRLRESEGPATEDEEDVDPVEPKKRIKKQKTVKWDQVNHPFVSQSHGIYELSEQSLELSEQDERDARKNYPESMLRQRRDLLLKETERWAQSEADLMVDSAGGWLQCAPRFLSECQMDRLILQFSIQACKPCSPRSLKPGNGNGSWILPHTVWESIQCSRSRRNKRKSSVCVVDDRRGNGSWT